MLSSDGGGAIGQWGLPAPGPEGFGFFRLQPALIYVNDILFQLEAKRFIIAESIAMAVVKKVKNKREVYRDKKTSCGTKVEEQRSDLRRLLDRLAELQKDLVVPRAVRSE